MGWRVSHLKLTLAASGLVALAGALVGWFVGGATTAIGVFAGVALAALSYTASNLAIAWADSINPRMVMPVGMAVYITKFSLLGAVLIFVGGSTWSGKIAFAMGIVAGVVVWTAAQIWWTVHHAPPYVEPDPRA